MSDTLFSDSFDFDSPLVASYCAGTLTPTEDAALARWLEERPARRAELERLRQAWIAVRAAPRPVIDTRQLWRDVSQSVGLSHAAAPVRHITRSIPPRMHRPARRSGLLWGTLAAAVLLVAAGVMTTLRRERPSSTTVTASSERATRVGERARFQLPDGTVVQLAPESRLRYATTFADARTVELEGEAVFTVTHLSGAPFVVHARGTRTQVLGTTFGVRAYATDSAVRVAVLEGRVQVNNGAVLSLGDLLVLRAGASEGSDAFVQRNSDVSALLGWTQGRLIFDHTPFATVARDLGRWYGLTITIRDAALARRPVTAEFENHSAQTVLDVLAGILQARYERQGDHVTFISQGAR